MLNIINNNKTMPKLKLSWIEFRNAAIMQLKEKYPMIDVTKVGDYLKEDDRGGIHECYELPEIIELELIDN